MTTAIYTRTSKEKNDGSFSISSQVDLCKDYARTKSLFIPDGYVFKEDFTGSVIERPEITKVRELVKSHAIKNLIIYATDRLARDIAVGTRLYDEMREHGVLLHIVKWGKAIDIENTNDKLHFNLEMTISDFEKESIRERLMRGKRQKASEGKYVAHARPLYGYSVNEDKDNLIFNEQSPIVKEILEGYGVKHINPARIADSLNARNIPTPGILKAEDLEESANKKLRIGQIGEDEFEELQKHIEWVTGKGLWSSSVIHSVLKKARNYTGNYTFKLKGVTYTVHPEPIISLEVAEAVEKMLSVGKNRFARKEGIGPFLMARRLKCTCGYTYGVRPKKSKYFNGYYSCMSTRDKKDCSNKPIRNDVLDPMVKAFIRGLLLEPDKIFGWWKKQHEQDEQSNQSTKDEIASIDKKLAELQSKLHRTLDKLTDNVDEDEVAYYTQQKESLKKMISSYRQSKENLEQSLVVTSVSQETIVSFAELGERYKPLLETSQSVEFWRGLIDDIDLTGEIGTDEQGEYIDFIVFGKKRDRKYIGGTDNDGSLFNHGSRIPVGRSFPAARQWSTDDRY